MKRRLVALGALAYAIFVPFEAVGGQLAEAAAWAMRVLASRPGTDEAPEAES